MSKLRLTKNLLESYKLQWFGQFLLVSCRVFKDVSIFLRVLIGSELVENTQV